VVEPVGASVGEPDRHWSRLFLHPAVRRGVLVGLPVLSVLSVVFVVLWLLERGGTARLSVGAGTLVLLFLLGVLVGGIGILSAMRLFEARAGLARRARYLAQAKERVGARREPEVTRVDRATKREVEAILLVDLVQSTELIGKHGDVFFRDLLRRIETAFIPVAREAGSRFVDGHGDGLLFCFGEPARALAALREMYARIPAINRVMPAGVEAAFRASLHVGEIIVDKHGNRTGLAVLKTVRLASAMESLRGRGAGRNSLVASEEAVQALGAAGATVTALGEVALRGFPGTHTVYQVDV
jgi:class 3 adenylate cyclase